MHRHNFPACRDKVFRKLSFDKDKMNEQFHIDVLVPNYVKEQQKWKEKVQKELEGLQEFESPAIKIKIEP